MKIRNILTILSLIIIIGPELVPAASGHGEKVWTKKNWTEADPRSNGHYSEFSHEGFYIKDYFVYRSPKDGVYHLFYNIGKAGPKQNWQDPFNEDQLGHATSKDLKNWEIHDYVLPCIPDSWESSAVSAPYVVQFKDTFYMAYTGFNGGNQRMGIATSTDLFNWTRVPENPVAGGPKWTTWKEKGWADYRDPGLLRWKGQWLAFNTIKDPKGTGGLAISISEDLLNWKHLPREKSVLMDWHAAESPVTFTREGTVYLIASSGRKRQMWKTDDPLSGKWEIAPFAFPAGWWTGWEYIHSPEGKELLSAFFFKPNGNFIRFWEITWDGDVPKLVEKND
jgi:hypothetical protein